MDGSFCVLFHVLINMPFSPHNGMLFSHTDMLFPDKATYFSLTTHMEIPLLFMRLKPLADRTLPIVI